MSRFSLYNLLLGTDFQKIQSPLVPIKNHKHSWSLGNVHIYHVKFENEPKCYSNIAVYEIGVGIKYFRVTGGNKAECQQNRKALTDLIERRWKNV